MCADDQWMEKLGLF